ALPRVAKKVGDTYKEDMQQNREDYLNEPNAILVVTMQEPEMEKQWEENYGAVATMIQNFWLLAGELDLGVVCKTNPHIYDPKVKEILDLEDDEKIVGFMNLGYFEKQPSKEYRVAVDDKFFTF